jgi:uncharacterized protein YfbU (UPF0304 family)
VPDNGDDIDGGPAYQLERAKVLEEGFTLEYWTEFAGLGNELSRRDSERVMDILELFRIAQDSIAHLQKEGVVIPRELSNELQYRGFDFNDALESKMAMYVRHMITDGRWVEQAEFVNGPSSGNSHSRTLETYLRMLAEYRRIRVHRRPTLGVRDYLLTLEELEAIAAERVHPNNR